MLYAMMCAVMSTATTGWEGAHTLMQSIFVQLWSDRQVLNQKFRAAPLTEQIRTDVAIVAAPHGAVLLLL